MDQNKTLSKISNYCSTKNLLRLFVLSFFVYVTGIALTLFLPAPLNQVDAVAQNYNDDPIVSIPFSEGSGKTASDTTGNGHGVTITGINFLDANSGFETGTYNPFTAGAWRGTLQIEWLASNVHTGTYSLKHTATSSDSFTQPWDGVGDIPVTGPIDLTFSAWAKASSANTEVRLYIFCKDQYRNPNTYGWQSATDTVGTSWKEASITHTCPAGTAFASVRLDVNTSGSTVWWDDLFFDEGTKALWPEGIEDKAFSFDGIDDYGMIANHASLQLTGDMSFSLWLKLDSYPTSWASILSKYANDTYTEFNFRMFNSTTAQFYYGNGASACVLNWNPSVHLPLGTWTKITGVRDFADGTLTDGDLKLYFNGVEAYTRTTCGGAAASAYNVYIGKQRNLSNYLDGTIDDLKIYNRAMSSDEAAWWYTVETDITPPTNPTSFTATVGGKNVHYGYVNTNNPTIDFTWSGASDNATGINNYQIVLQRVSDGTWLYSPQVGSAASYSLATNGLVNAESYYYWIRAQDGAGNWASAFALGGMFTIDNTKPTQDTVTLSNQNWRPNGINTYDVTVKVSDIGSGMARGSSRILALLFKDTHWASARGYFSWKDSGYSWSADQVACSGGGYASKHPSNYGYQYVTLTGCSTSISGNQRTVTFTVLPNTSFGDLTGMDVAVHALDNAGNNAGWKDFLDINFVSDGTAPTQDSLTLSNQNWQPNGINTYDITLTASDAGSGVYIMLARINYQGDNSTNNRGAFSWKEDDYNYSTTYSTDRIECIGGGYADKYNGPYGNPTGYGKDYITLTGCTTTVNGNQRTVIFTVQPHANFGNFNNNDISFSVYDRSINLSSWTNYDLNFVSDGTAPAQDSLTISSQIWQPHPNGINKYDITAVATDTGSGIREMRTLINHQGANYLNKRGYFAWRETGYTWGANGTNQIECTGGGYAEKYNGDTGTPIGYGREYSTLAGCTTSVNGNQRTVTFTIQPHTNFGDFGNNDISFWVRDNALNISGWTNYDLNFISDYSGPTQDSLTISNSLWLTNGTNTYDITLKATDTLTGVRNIRALINLQGANSTNHRGYFVWDLDGHTWDTSDSTDRKTCTGGGYAEKYNGIYGTPVGHGSDHITLEGCSTAVSGSQRTVTFTVKPESNFGDFDNNDISFWTEDVARNFVGWTNYDLNFISRYSNAVFISQNVPDNMVAEQQYNVSVTMQNTGNSTWSSADDFMLGSQNPADNHTWGFSRIVLDGTDSITTGQSKQFDFIVTAPGTPGTYDFQWKMVQESVEWFGELTPNVSVVVEPISYDAQFVLQTAPVDMTAGETYSVSVRMKNTSNVTWSEASGEYLKSQNPEGNTTWGISSAGFTADEDPIGPGSEKEFSFAITAPSTLGMHDFQWQMAQSDRTTFGQLTENVTITVHPDSQFVAQNVPATMTGGATYTVSVTMLNNSPAAWLETDGVELTALSNNWNIASEPLAPGEVITEGESKVFSFEVTAPTTAGSYDIQWQMAYAGGTYFGETTPNSMVVVDPSPRYSEVVSYNVPSFMSPGEAVNVSVKMRNAGIEIWSGQLGDELRSQNPPGNSTWGMISAPMGDNTFFPGESKEFLFNVTAPETPGVYDFQWQLANNGVYFGEATPNVKVTIDSDQPPYNSRFVSQDIPAYVSQGDSFNVSITMENTGLQYWTMLPPHNIWLTSQNPLGNMIWGRQNAPVGEDYYFTGSTKEFSFTVFAPSELGTYNFQWQMTDGYGVPFGAMTPNLEIEVVPPDIFPPTQESVTVSSLAWQPDGVNTYDITLVASDSGSGVRDMLASINYQGDNSANQRGRFSWRADDYYWNLDVTDHMECTGGGYAQKYEGPEGNPVGYGQDYITLTGCITSLVGAERTVTFTVMPHVNFGDFGNNDISMLVADYVGNSADWTNYDLNFVVDFNPPVLNTLVVSDNLWNITGKTEYSIIMAAEDAVSGLETLQALINFQYEPGEGTARSNNRGRFAWSKSSYRWGTNSEDKLFCTNKDTGLADGYAEKYSGTDMGTPPGYGAPYITLTGCNTTFDTATGERVVEFIVRPHLDFGDFTDNDVSGMAKDFSGNSTGWQNYDLDFTSYKPLDQDSEFVSASFLEYGPVNEGIVLEVGEEVTTTIVMKNTGVEDWINDPTSSEDFKLGVPGTDQHWGTIRVSIPSEEEVVFGEEYAFTFTVKAPIIPGVYNFNWKMVKETVTWFGEAGPGVQITVLDSNAPESPASFAAEIGGVDLNGQVIGSGPDIDIDFSWNDGTDHGSGIIDEYKIILKNSSGVEVKNDIVKANKIQNISFEDGTIAPFAGASNDGVLASDIWAYEGNRSLKLTANTQGTYATPWDGQNLYPVEDTSIEYPVYFKLMGKGGIGTEKMSMYIFCKDEQGTASWGGPVNHNMTTTWTEYSHSYTCPTGTKNIGVRFGNIVPGTYVRVDKAVVKIGNEMENNYRMKLTGLAEGDYTYYIRAKDLGDNWSTYKSGGIFTLDFNPPVLNDLTVSDNVWKADGMSEYTITMSAKDSGSDVSLMKAYINYQNNNTPKSPPRGNFGWQLTGYPWGSGSVDHQNCTGNGGGFAGKNSSTDQGGQYITLVSCYSEKIGKDRIVTLTVRPHSNFGNYINSNDISFYAIDVHGNATSQWTNYDLNFTTDEAPVKQSLTVSDNLWGVAAGTNTYNITLTASDYGTGVNAIAAIINYNNPAETRRGYFAWKVNNYYWPESTSADRRECLGGGKAAKYTGPNEGGFGHEHIELLGCSTSLVGSERTVTFTVRPKSSFGDLTDIDISFYAVDNSGVAYKDNEGAWTNYNLNFESDATYPTSPGNFKGWIGGSDANGQILNYTTPNINLTWNPSLDANGINGYEIVLQKAAHSGPATNILVKWVGNITNYTITTSGPGETLAEGRYYYWIRAKDAAGNVEVYHTYGGSFTVDTQPPTVVGITRPQVEDTWLINGDRTYYIEAKATDEGSGIEELQVLINLQGDNTDNQRGLLAWASDHYPWGADGTDKVLCISGIGADGYASKYNGINDRGQAYITLVGCTTTLNAQNERIVTFKVRPHSGFGEFFENNDISVNALDSAAHESLWQNHDLNFTSTALIMNIPFIEADGTTVTDYSGQGHNGTVEGATWKKSEGIENAMHYDGSGTQIVRVDNHTDFNIDGSYTILAWIKIDGSYETGTMGIMGKESDYGYGLNIVDGKLSLGRHNCGHVTGSTVLEKDKWYQVAGVFQQGTGTGEEDKVYLDGELDGQGNLTDGDCGTASNSSDIVIGRYRGSITKDFKGFIGRVTIYGRALAQTEIGDFNPRDRNSEPFTPNAEPINLDIEGARGLASGTAYSMGDFDSVNAMTGNLSVSLPIGQSYQVGPDLSYGLSLTYNSNLWDAMDPTQTGSTDGGFLNNPISAPAYTLYPAGLGWQLSVGELFQSTRRGCGTPSACGEANWPNQSKSKWLYVGPDGSRIYFYENEDTPGWYYSTGSPSTRLHELADDSGVMIEFENGTIHTFEYFGVEAFCGLTGPLEGKCTRLKTITDRVTDDEGNHVNQINFAYSFQISIPFPQDPEVKITDSMVPGRTTTIKFSLDEAAGGEVYPNRELGDYKLVVDYVDVPTFGGGTARYDFTYTNVNMQKGCPVNIAEPIENRKMSLPLLSTLTRPEDGGTHNFDYYYQAPSSSEDVYCDYAAGVLKEIEFPTKSRVVYEYDDYFLPSTCPDGRRDIDLPYVRTAPNKARVKSKGVTKRTILENSDDTSAKTINTYSQFLTEKDYRSVENELDVQGYCVHDNVSVTDIVTIPVVNNTYSPMGGKYLVERTYHTVTKTDNAYHPHSSKDTADTSDDELWGIHWYGKPVTLNRDLAITHGGEEYYLSKELLLCPGPEYCGDDEDKNIQEATYLRYAFKPSACSGDYDDPTCSNMDAMIEKQIVKNGVSAETGQTTYQYITNSEYDGFGHMKTVTESGSGFERNSTSTTTTNYTAAAGGTSTINADGIITSDLQYPATTSAWLPNLYDYNTTTVDGNTSRVDYKFDTDTGLLTCTRTRTSEGKTSSTDIAVYTTRDSLGFPLWQEVRGGDKHNAASCAANPAGGSEYYVKTVYEYGSLKQSSYTTAVDGTQIGALVNDNTIDANTGLVNNFCDNSASTKQCVNVSYDNLSRITSRVPDNFASTDYTYTLKDFTDPTKANEPPGKVEVSIKDTSEDENILGQSEIHFDSFGRQIVLRDHTSSGWVKQETTYTPLDTVAIQTTMQSETGFNGNIKTVNSYDAYGRLRSVTDPNGKVSEIIYPYSGNDTFKKTISTTFTGLAEQRVMTKEVYDNLGRVYKLKEGIPEESKDNWGSAARLLTTNYGSNNKTELVMSNSAGTGTTQARTTWMDDRGFTTKVEVPEWCTDSNSDGSCSSTEQKAATSTYDSLGNTKASTNPDGKVITTIYDGAGRVTEVYENKGQTSEKLLKEMTYYATTGKLYQSIAHNYFTSANSFGLLDNWIGTAGEIDIRVTETYTYNSKGQLATLDTDITKYNVGEATSLPMYDYTQSWTYDDLGRVETTTYPTCTTTAQCLSVNTNDFGAPTSRIITNVYNKGQLDKVKENALELVDLDYYGNGATKKVDLYNGGVLETTEQHTTLGTNGRGTPILSQKTVTSGGSVKWNSGTYTFDGNYNIKGITGRYGVDGAPKNYSHTYDTLNRIEKVTKTSEINLTYSYDIFDNITGGTNELASTTTNQANNRLKTAGGLSMTYNLNGNITDWSTHSFKYNSLDNQMSYMNDPAGDDFYKAVYVYNVTGQRVWTFDRLEDPAYGGESGNGAAETMILTTRDHNGNILREYKHLEKSVADGGGWDYKYKDYLWAGGKLVATEDNQSNGEWEFMHTDHLGSVVLGTNLMGGAVEEDDYYPYGKAKAVGGSTNNIKSKIRFSGHELDGNMMSNGGVEKDGSGITYNMGARTYWPELGRFISVDPAKSGWNLYSYASNNPVNRVDPDGEDDKPAITTEEAMAIMEDILWDELVGGSSNLLPEPVPYSNPRAEAAFQKAIDEGKSLSQAQWAAEITDYKTKDQICAGSSCPSFFQQQSVGPVGDFLIGFGQAGLGPNEIAGLPVQQPPMTTIGQAAGDFVLAMGAKYEFVDTSGRYQNMLRIESPPPNGTPSIPNGAIIPGTPGGQPIIPPGQRPKPPSSQHTQWVDPYWNSKNQSWTSGYWKIPTKKQDAPKNVNTANE